MSLQQLKAWISTTVELHDLYGFTAYFYTTYRLSSGWNIQQRSLTYQLIIYGLISKYFDWIGQSKDDLFICLIYLYFYLYLFRCFIYIFIGEQINVLQKNRFNNGTYFLCQSNFYQFFFSNWAMLLGPLWNEISVMQNELCIIYPRFQTHFICDLNNLW